ncbi:MAG: DUF6531 domain-containing protein, partial [Gammaproteobacteria bacterium]|nr:DUF6531 domain-containing protein [Gammaproteobacteria bacterium]
MLQTVKLVNEVGSRRRVNTIFPNPQAARDGVQVAYVNTTSGNLTFSTRDIVIPGPLPIMFGRVYDSRNGWRLTYAASFTRTDAGFVLRDATGSHLFIDAGHGVGNFRNFRNFLNIDEPSLSGAVLEQRPGELLLRTDTLEHRFFQHDVDVYLIRSIEKISPVSPVSPVGDLYGEEDQRGRIEFDYDGRSIIRIFTAQAAVTITYVDGVPTHATDTFGREVRYHFGAARQAPADVGDVADAGVAGAFDNWGTAGNLASYTDLGGRVWRYDYDRNSRLRGVVRPDGVHAFSVRYGRNNKTIRVQDGDTATRFTYRKRRTVVRTPYARVTIPHRVAQIDSVPPADPAPTNAYREDGALTVIVNGQKFRVEQS